MIIHDNPETGLISYPSPWYLHPFFKYAAGTLLVLLIILVFYHVTPFLKPFVDFISILFVPIVLAFLFYYLLRPIVLFLEKCRVPRLVSILAIYAIFAVTFVFFFIYGGPFLLEQIAALANISIETLQKGKRSVITFLEGFHINVDYEIQQRLFGVIQEFTSLLTENIVDVVGFVTRVTAILAVIPFIVFYLLKDDHDFSEGFLKYLSEDVRRDASKILGNIDLTLSNYINGLVLVSSSVGGLLFIGYLLIGLNYALILSVIALVLTTIPFLGPFLAIAPAILVGMSQEPIMVFKVIVVFLIVQQFEANLISPQIIGQRLHMHPLTIILLLLAAGSLYGLIGLILATPLYAVSKVLFENLYKIYRLRGHRWRKNLA